MAIYTYENNIEYAPFNSINKDRTINATHLQRWLSSVNSDGVTHRFDEFKCTIANDLNVVVGSGIGFVAGCHMYLKSSQTIQIDQASVSGDRIDTIGFRLQVADRKVLLYYKTGEAGSGNPPEILNNSAYIEIPLYNITVPKNATTLTESNLQDVRVYVVSSATYFKKYNQIHNATSTIKTLTITVPFNSETDDIDIYVNGIVLLANQYSISGNVITFNSSIYSGNEIQINVWHFQDGSGSMDSLNKVLEKIQEVDNTMKYYYHCTGANDNIKLSQIAQDFLNATGDFSGISATAQMEIIVCGDLYCGNNYSGNGTQSYPYTKFAFGKAATSTRTIYFDFGNCSRISVACDSGYTTIFSGADINVRNVALNVEAGEHVDIFNGTNIHCQDSEFWMSTWGDCCVGRCCGYFDKVRTSIASTGGNAYCFYGNGRLLRVIGGDHYAWTSASGKEAVCFYVEAYQTENVMHVTMANMPEYARSGYTQTRPVKINNGYATFLQNTMWLRATVDNGSFYDSTKCIAYGNVELSKN